MAETGIRELRSPSADDVDTREPRRRHSVIPRQGMPRVRCAFCASDATEPTSIYGCHMMTAQYYCRDCKSMFDWVRDEWNADA